MAELEQRLHAIGAAIEWPATPPLTLRLERRARGRLPVRPVWVALAAILLALAVALSVPAARSAILRVFHLGGVTVERSAVLPPAQERSLSAGLGPVVGGAAVRNALGGPMRLPNGTGTPRFHLLGGVVSVVLATPQPVLLSELRSDAELLKKIAGTTTNVTWLQAGSGPALWISGAEHVVVFPRAAPRLAGNVLVWESNGITYRLEGARLSRAAALRLAAEIAGT
jgi:hypothetical protein